MDSIRCRWWPEWDVVPTADRASPACGSGPTPPGIVIGLAGAVAASHAVVRLLFGVSRLDPVTYLGVVGLLLGVSGIACSVPAWRAALVDHSITLRAE